MSKHIWAWDKVSANPMRVVCVKCGQRELLSKVLNELGCEGCPVESIQGKLFEGEGRHEKRNKGSDKVSRV